jgi:hypothetical protein
MKKAVILTIGLLVFVKFSQAQTTFGATVGASFASYKVKSGDVSAASDVKPGFSIGLSSFIGLNKSFSFQPSLNFVQKGGIFKDPSESTTNKSTFDYLELPLNFIYNTHSVAGKFFIGAGPSFDIGLSGRYKITGMYEESGSVHFGNSESDDLKRIGVGLNLLAGYAFKSGMLISGNYNFSLSNLSNNSDATLRNRYFGIRLGYLFVR